MKTYEFYRLLLQDFSISTVTDFRMLQRTTERLNVVHSGKSALSFLRQSFYKLYKEKLAKISKTAADGQSTKEFLWTVFALVPFEVEIVLKE